MSRCAFASLPSPLYRFLRISAIFLFFAGLALAQVQPGTPNWSAIETHAVDSINLSNLVVSLNIPVRSKAGAIPFNFGFINGSSYVANNAGALAAGYSTNPLAPAANGMLMTSTTFATYGYLLRVPATDCGGSTGYAYKTEDWYVAFADGTQHPLPATDILYWDNAGCTFDTTITDTTTDGSGINVKITGTATGITYNYIYDPMGNSYANTGGSSVKLKDVFGNSITYDGVSKWTDTLGEPVITEPTAGTFQWTNVAGGTPNVAVTNTSYTLQSNFGCSSATDYSTPSQEFPTQISFSPDSTDVKLAWEQTNGYGTTYTTGRIQKITLRTGGTVTYNWNPNGTGNDGLNCSEYAPNEISRTTTDGTTTYSVSWLPSGGSCSSTALCSTTTEVDPGGNKTVYYFSAGWGAAYPVTLALTRVEKYKNTGTPGSPTYSSYPDSRDTRCYNTGTYSGTTSGLQACVTASVSLPITETFTYHQEGSGSVSTPGSPSAVLTAYDSTGAVTYSYLYDYGSSTYGFYTHYTYPSVVGLGDAANVPNEIEKFDASGNKLSDVKYTLAANGRSVTSTSVYNGSTYIGQSSSNVYNGNGTISKSFDVANNETDYAYVNTGYSDCGTLACTALTTYPFPTTITNKTTGLYTQATWDALGGVMLSSTDTALNTTNFGYYNSCGTSADPFWRVGCVTDPLLNAHGVSYLDSSNEVQTSFSFNSGNSAINTTSTVDGYGRSIDFQKETGPSTGSYDTTSKGYSWPSAYFQVFNSMPCNTTSLGTGCGSAYGVNTIYDVLNRPVTATETGSNGVTTYSYPVAGSETKRDVLIQRGPAPSWDGEHVKQVQNEYDGFGRLTTSCAIGTVPGSAACNEVTGSSSGIVTTYAYTTGVGYYEAVATRGSQAKTTYTDSLGRVTETITPDAGTWNYYYDSVSTPGCPSGYTGVIGKLEASKDPNGNLICYKYDALNRVTGINANGTTCRHFYYDTSYGTVPSGVTTPTNTLGRLAEASTDNCSGTLITDEWFSYDKDGNKTDLWESTPNAGRYYHSTATFAGNGAVLTLNLKTEYTNTYTLDGEGRWTSLVNSNVPQTQVSSVAYNAASQPTQVNIGSGTDNDAYTYDPNTGRMTQYVFTVGSANETGVLTWNPIGSLKALAITDGFHSDGTQICNMGSSTSMGYDDMNRLLMDDCGSGGWGQTFSYDAYNNLTKALISGRTGTTFNPGYNTLSGCSPCNNQYATGYGASYDSDGNQLYDPSNMNTYTWNAWSKLASVDMSGTGCSTSGECIIYDAFGRIVEVDSGSTYTETFYTQAGKGVFHGAAKVTGLWPAPGAGIVGDSTAFMHQDWLGSVRLGHTISTSTVTFDHALTPYGEMYARSGSASYGENNFTGDVQAIVSGTSGLWDTPNRELGTAPSRWLSPDPIGASWNAYAYVTNPNSAIDPSGLKYCIGVAAPGCVTSAGGGSEDGEDGAGSDPLDGDMNEMSTLGPGGEDYDASSGGTVGGDGSTVSAATLTYFDSLGSQGGTLTGGSEPYSTPDPNISAILGTFQPSNPVLCGPGIPCSVRQKALFPFPRSNSQGWQWSSYEYTVVDVNGDPVNVDSVVEDLQSIYGPVGNAGLWCTGGCTGVLANGSFVDNVAMMPDLSTIGGFESIQTFSVLTGGLSYQLSTQIVIQGVWFGSTAALVATVQRP